jgi:protein SCO1/2
MPFRAADRGLLLVYFGYTLCPDVCPTTMSDLRLALGDLAGEDRSRVGVAMVTVDPDRDTPSILGSYVRSFVPDGHALRTDDAALLARVAQAFGAGYGVTETADGTIEVSHTAFTYAVDDDGRLLLQWPFGTRWEDIRDDIETLLDAEENAP